jgi:hypothetical protein
MTAPQPILNAEYVLRKALHDAFVPLLSSYTDSAGRVKVYYKRADQEDANKQPITVPYLIYQPQSDIAALRWVGVIDAEALFTIRALAAKQSAAETLLGLASPGMASLSATGYTIQAIYERTPTIPPDGDVWTVAHIYRIHISIA